MKISISCFLTLAFIWGSIHMASGQNPLKTGHKYKVVINHEEQYSIWLSDMTTPKGWKDTDITGSYNKCHKYIEEVWTDMRPLSIRKKNLSKNTKYAVVINHEEQYSIWPLEMTLPSGWKATGTKGDLSTCMDYIEEVWTDMRPSSLRKHIKQ